MDENYGLCHKCRSRVPADHVIRDGCVYLRKQCPDCGETEALVSTDAATWQRKREICHYDGDISRPCSLNCDQCNMHERPRMVFMDVTNRCNMNCPICIANIPAMGFEFNPPIEYFEHILEELGKWDPKPLVQLFGGEPTVRDDMFEIIGIARRNGLDARVVTNGLKLADEEYCKRLCDEKVHVLLGFDGDAPEIYDRLRKNPTAYRRKRQALDNLAKYSRHKNTIMCCVARHINDQYMRDLIELCHERRSYIKCLHCIPLTETWEEGEFETDVATTTEDVEQILDEAFPGEMLEFLPAGLSENLRLPARFFGVLRLKFGGAHPNCESAAVLVSDGERYRPLSHYLTRPLDDIAEDVVTRCEEMKEKLGKLDPEKKFDRLRGRLTVLRKLLPLAVRALDFKAIAGGSRLACALKILGGLLTGKKPKDLLRRHTDTQDVMLMIVLPFEEYHSVESARLSDCWAGFVYEDPDTDEVRTIPVCIWGEYKTDLQRKIARKYETRAAVKA